ncbi:hypothetical protein PENTCL1PPCAC_7780, partial [Pristionchus entomophagus]
FQTMPETADSGATSGAAAPAERGGGGNRGGGRSGGGRNQRGGGSGGGGNRGGGGRGSNAENSGGGTNRRRGDSNAENSGGGTNRRGGDNNAENSGGNNRRERGGDNNGRRSPQHHHQQQGGGGGGRNEQRHNKKIGDHKVDMRKYERMITATQSNFSDIKISNPITEDCLICCKPNDIFGVGPCRHPLCIECAIRIRVIANSEGCPVCRQPMETMAFVFTSADPSTISLNMPSIHPDEKRYKVQFQNKEASARYEKYLSHVCKLCVSDGERKEFNSFISLKQHMAQTHQLSFCHHCVANLQLFSRERTTYNRSQLQEHIRGGDRDDRSQKGHPKCLFCEERFFDEDDRYRHLRREHFFCQLCETTGAAANVFFGKHDELLKHYEQKHFLCEVDECKKAGIAFATKLDLDIHTSREHGKVNLAVDFSFNDRQVGGPSRNRGGRQYGGPSHNAPPPLLQGPRGVGLVPAADPPPPRSDPSQFVVVPSAQASRPNLRYARQGGFSGVTDSEAFPSLGPSIASSSAGINYASGPPVVVPTDFPRLKSQPNRPPPPPAVSAANIASGAAKKKDKKKETREEAFPTLGGSSRHNHQQQQETPQWARHTDRFDVIDDDERDAFQTVDSIKMGPPPRVGPSVQPSRVAMVKRPATQLMPKGKQPAPMPSSADGDDFPDLPPSTGRIDYGRVGGPLAQSSKWGKKAAEQKRPPPPPLPEPEMWPAMSSSTAVRPVEIPDWQEHTVKLSKKALARRENAEKNAKKKEEKRLAREAREAEERGAVRMDSEEEDEEESEDEEEEEEIEETKKEPERVLGLSEISRLIPTAPPSNEKKDGKNKGKEQPKEPQPKKEEPKSAPNANNNKKKEKKGGASSTDSAPSKPIDNPPLATVSQSSSLGLIGSLFNSVYSSFVGGGDATAAAQNGTAAKPTTNAAAAAAQARGLSTAPPPGLSFAPPPGFGPPPGFENAVKRS